VARDLIPPPSPAGRPSPDPDRDRREDAEAARAPRRAEGLAEEAAPPPPSGPSPFRSRFGFVLGALLGVGVAAAAGFALLVGSESHEAGGSSLADSWSSWAPTATDVFTGPAQIASHVGRDYWRGDGTQLVTVTGGPLQISGVPFAIQVPDENGAISTLGSNGVMYTLSGLGEEGRIKGGKPSAKRHVLLRREALELALYTFHYLPDITMVVALLPPTDPKASGAGKQDPQLQAVFYRPGDLAEQLRTPLKATLPPGRQEPATLTGAESERVQDLTLPNLFRYEVQVTQDRQAYLVLERPKAPEAKASKG